VVDAYRFPCTCEVAVRTAPSIFHGILSRKRSDRSATQATKLSPTLTGNTHGMGNVAEYCSVSSTLQSSLCDPTAGSCKRMQPQPRLMNLIITSRAVCAYSAEWAVCVEFMVITRSCNDIVKVANMLTTLLNALASYVLAPYLRGLEP
jgi:hypothetical protein